MHSKTFFALTLLGAAALGVIGSLWFAAKARHELAVANQALAKAERRIAAAEARAQKAEAPASAEKPVVAVRADGSTPPPVFEAPLAWKKAQRSPAFFRTKAEEMRAGLIKNYAVVFRKLQLSPEDFRRLQDLMIERNMVGMEIANAQDELTGARLTTAQMQKLLTDQKAAIDQETARLLGPEKSEIFQNFNRTLDSRHEVNDIALGLDISRTPITEDQVDELTDSLAAVEAKLRAAHKNSLPSSIPLEARRAADAEFLAAIKATVDATQLARVTEYFEKKRSLEEERRRMGEELTRLKLESPRTPKP